MSKPISEQTRPSSTDIRSLWVEKSVPGDKPMIIIAIDEVEGTVTLRQQYTGRRTTLPISELLAPHGRFERVDPSQFSYGVRRSRS